MNDVWIRFKSSSFHSPVSVPEKAVWGRPWSPQTWHPPYRQNIYAMKLKFIFSLIEYLGKSTEFFWDFSKVFIFPTLGRYLQTSALNYLNYFREKEESSIVKQSLKISIDLHYNGHNSFYSSLMKMTDHYNFCDFNCNS